MKNDADRLADTLNCLSQHIEFEKLANAITHVVSIRDMITQYFNPDHGYQSVQISDGPFWGPIP